MSPVRLSAIRKARRLSTAEWRALAIATRELAIARICCAAMPMSTVLERLRDTSPPPHSPTFDEAEIHRLSWAISTVAIRLPWRSDCLLQALAATRWLRRCGLQPEFFLGSRKDANGQFEAHAWLQCRGISVTGGTGIEFAILLRPTDSRPQLPASAHTSTIRNSAATS